MLPSLIGCCRGGGLLEVVGDGLVEVHGHLQEEVPHTQVAPEQARRFETETEGRRKSEMYWTLGLHRMGLAAGLG